MELTCYFFLGCWITVMATVLSCNYLGIGSRTKLRLKSLFLLGGKIALTAITETNMKAENNMLEVRNPICNVLRL